MAFTRFSNDKDVIQKRLCESTFNGIYHLNTPGNGLNMPYVDDTHIRLQKWGGNLMTNTINLESDLFGLSRNMNRDLIGTNDYKKHAVKTHSVQYSSFNPITDQSRATHPAWMLRDLEQFKQSILPLNPQENTCMTFQNNLSTRILEKDTFVAKSPNPVLNT